MAYPCFGCGGETGPECLCDDCRDDLPNKIVNGKWCPKHQIIHWSGDPCPLCDDGVDQLVKMSDVMKACSACGERNNLNSSSKRLRM